MCGIAGHISLRSGSRKADTELAQRLAYALQHRGPDEFGLYRDSQAILVSTRLSIVDLQGGQQPISNEDETLWVVFNGEIFNHVELKDELESHGHRFRTRSDTEVLVHGYEQWGPSCFGRFNGQWALAMWDRRKRSLLLARDRVGVRPLYVAMSPKSLRFASEVKGIFADPEVERELDLRGLDQTLTYWSTVAPQTMFAGIEEIRPGYFHQYDTQDQRMVATPFWRPSFRESGEQAFSRDLGNAAERLKELLFNATQLRVTRADVPVGSYLSGGLDSSIVATLGRKAKEGEFKTFSIRFEDDEFDETTYQRTLVEKLGSTHQELMVRKSDIADVFPNVIWHTERPILRTAPAPMFLLSKLVRDSGIKAVLTGEGADEILGGYDIFKEAKIREFWARQPESKSRPKLFERLYPYLARSPRQTKSLALAFWGQGLVNAGKPGFSHDRRWLTTSAVKRFLSVDALAELRKNPPADIIASLPGEFSRWNTLGQAQYLELLTLFPGYIISSQGDRMLMGHSVEGRFPFLDVEVMEFCNALPEDYKLRLLDEKHILKLMARELIPPEIIRRPKQPYRSPDAESFFQRPMQAYVEEAFSPDTLAETGIFDVSLSRALYEKCARTFAQGGQSSRLGHSDNMSVLAILSTILLMKSMIQSPSIAQHDVHFDKIVDFVDVQTQ